MVANAPLILIVCEIINAREETHPHDARDRRIQVLSLFMYFNYFTNLTEVLT